MYPSKLCLNSFQSALLFTVCLFFANKSNAQKTDSIENNLIVTAQLRPRFELRDGAFRPLRNNEKPAALISERIRFNIDYTYKDVVTVRLSPQTVGIWGQANMVQSPESGGNKLALFEAWTKIKLSKDWNVKVGRQVISLDDERFFGELDWAQGGRAHDALSFHFNKNKYEWKTFLAYNQNYKTVYANNISNPAGSLYNSSDAMPYKWMQAVWVSLPVDPQSKITLLATNVGFQNALTTTTDTVTNFSQTFGANYFLNNKKMAANISVYYQGGKNVLGAKTNAYLLAVYAGYNATPKWSIGIGSDLLSGNDVGVPQSNNNVFTPYFHTGHKFYGNMDYFYVGNGHKNTGLSDTYIKANYKNDKGLTATMTLHQFIAPNKITNFTTTYKKNLGQEFDLMLSKKLNKIVNFSGGYSFYLNNTTLNYLKSTPTANNYQQWVWLGINVTPTLIKSKF